MRAKIAKSGNWGPLSLHQPKISESSGGRPKAFMVASWRGIRVSRPDWVEPESVDGIEVVPGEFGFDFGDFGFQIST